MVQKMADAGADVNAQDVRGCYNERSVLTCQLTHTRASASLPPQCERNTPLILAARERAPAALVAALLAAGADPKMENNDRENAHQTAVTAGCSDEVIEMLAA